MQLVQQGDLIIRTDDNSIRIVRTRIYGDKKKQNLFQLVTNLFIK